MTSNYLNSPNFTEPGGSLQCSEQPPPPLVTILIQKNPVSASSSYFFNIHFNIILRSTPLVLQVLPSLGLSPYRCMKACVAHNTKRKTHDIRMIQTEALDNLF